MKIVKAVTETKRIKSPEMTDEECYLRLGVPEGLQCDGSYPKRFGVVQDAYGPQIPHNKKGMGFKAAQAVVAAVFGAQ